MKKILYRVLGSILVCSVLAACEPTNSPPGQNGASSTTASSPEPAAISSMEASTPATATDCSLTVGWDPWEPYHYQAAGGELHGLDIDIIQQVAEQAGCDLDFLQGSWDGLLRLLRAGELDVMMGATRIPARENYAFFSEPYRSEIFRLFVLAGSRDNYADKTLTELLQSGFRLGITQGYYYGEDVSRVLEQPEFQPQIREAAVGELNFTRLLDMQIDGFIEDAFVAAAIERRRRDAGQIVAIEPTIRSGPVTFMFSRASVAPETVERFDRALADLRKSGRHQQLLEQYLE